MLKSENKQWKKIIKTFEQHPSEIMNVVPTPRMVGRKQDQKVCNDQLRTVQPGGLYTSKYAIKM